MSDKIPACNDISVVIKFPSNLSQRYYFRAIKFIVNIPQNGYLSSYTSQNSISTNGKTIEHSHEPLLFVVLYRLQEG